MHFAVIEMKSGRNAKAKEAIAQIVAGIEAADQIVGATRIAEFFPILMHRGLSTTEFRVLRTQKVTFRGRSRLVVTRRCGHDLGEIMR